jgi:hypothetical protein
MAFGYDRLGRVFLNNSFVLEAFLYTQDGQVPIPQEDIAQVKFTVLKPGDDPSAPTISNANGTVEADGLGRYVVAGSVNDTEGEYRGYATFTYDEDTMTGLVRSVPVFYDVVDVFERAGPSPMDPAVDYAWMRLEDCFDSEFGGPWLRDMTLRVFDKTKLRQFGPSVLLQINSQMPFTDYTIDGYPWGDATGDTMSDAAALFGQGLFVATVRHLMVSYTEQPDVVSSPVAYLDRRKYQQAWKAIYDVEEPLFERWVNRFKLRSYDLSHGALLLGSKAGRMLPAPMRSRNVGRGY